jgi:enoyl reductase-like protein
MEVIASSSDKERPPLWKDPIWKDKNNRQVVARRLTLSGEYAVVHIDASGGVNKDFDEILEIFGEEALDESTVKHKEEAQRQEQIHRERQEADQVRQKQEVLFNMKLEAFEIEEIKNSSNRDLKKRLRKAKTPIEVQSYATLLIQEALANEE